MANAINLVSIILSFLNCTYRCPGRRKGQNEKANNVTCLPVISCASGRCKASQPQQWSPDCPLTCHPGCRKSWEAAIHLQSASVPLATSEERWQVLRLCQLLQALDFKLCVCFQPRLRSRSEVLIGPSLIWGESGWPRLSLTYIWRRLWQLMPTKFLPPQSQPESASCT